MLKGSSVHEAWTVCTCIQADQNICCLHIFVSGQIDIGIAKLHWSLGFFLWMRTWMITLYYRTNGQFCMISFHCLGKNIKGIKCPAPFCMRVYRWEPGIVDWVFVFHTQGHGFDLDRQNVSDQFFQFSRPESTLSVPEEYTAFIWL